MTSPTHFFNPSTYCIHSNYMDSKDIKEQKGTTNGLFNVSNFARNVAVVTPHVDAHKVPSPVYRARG